MLPRVMGLGQIHVMSEKENQIVVYQPNETVRLDVRLENETVWLTQEQIANLFGTQRPAITKHLANIYKSGELEREGTCSILEHMGNECGCVISSQFQFSMGEAA